MKTHLATLAACSLFALLGMASTAMADSAAANCEVRKDGDKWKGASGPCTFSQRQGNINLDLKNGDSYSLVPSGKEGQYRDQKGTKVVRTVSGNTEEFRWDGGKKIIMTYTGAAATNYPSSAAGSGAGAGSSVPSLRDLVGTSAASGEMAMRNRGYTLVGGEKSGGNSYTYWRENENGQCVVARTSNGRYASIAYATDIDCRNAASSGGGGGSASRNDEFPTVCGVIVGGQTYSYRCSATDIYSGNQKVKTILKYPDQTIELTWRSGNRVGLQFEGMVPKEARYGSGEGEINFAFEDKTYFYYADKSRASWELQHFRN